MKLRLLVFIAAVTLLSGAAFAQDWDPTPEFQAEIGAPVVTGDTTWSVELMPIFEAAAARYNVPLPLLLALGYYGSAYENRRDAVNIDGGYGVMGLRQKDADFGIGADSLALAAQLTGVPEATVKTDPTANINGAAAVLAYYATMWQVDRTNGLDAWLDVVITYAALDKADPDNPDAPPVFGKLFASGIYHKLSVGIDHANTSGERVQMVSQNIGSVNPSALEPPAEGVSAGYSGATWYPAASCNYSAYYTSKNTVVMHTIQGSAAGCLSWIRNCNSNVSIHYVTSESGRIWQAVDENYRAWHVGCANNYCLGIENEGYAESSSHPTALYNIAAAATRDMCNRWGIPKQKRSCPPGVLGHYDINHCVCGGSHWDPGNGWNWTYFMQQVNGGAPPPPSYAATYNAQSYPSTMTAGSTATAWVEYKNTGTSTWGHAGTKLGTQGPQDRSSPFYNAGNWESASRPSAVDQSAVSTNQIGRFTFILKAPATPGTYVEKFKPVQEGVTWFGSEITWTITVTASKGNITGTVRDAHNNDVIAGATVAISGGPSTTTNSAGSYTFTGLDPANYTLNVSKSGYNPASGTAAVTAGNTTTKNFTLTSSDATAPTVPTGLAAAAISPSQINLAWNASTDSGGSGLAGYIVFRGGVEVGRTTGTTYTDNGLAANTAYTYTVKSYDNAGNVSGASSPASATTQLSSVPIFQDGFANTNYWQALVESAMPGPYPPDLVANHDHSDFPGGNSLQTKTSDVGTQGCLIGHTFTTAFAAAKYETYFFDGTGIGYRGDFDGGTEGWASYPNAYVTLSSVAGGSSGNCLSVLDHGWTGGFYKEFNSGFAAGDACTFSISLKVPTVGTWGTAPYLFLRFRDGAGATIGTETKVNINADNNWHAYNLTGTAPAGTATIWIGAYMYLNATADYTSYVDWATLTTSASIHNNSRQGLQVRCHDGAGTVRAIYYLGTYSAAPGTFDTYSAGYYKIGDVGWTWPGAACATRSVGWHKLTIDIQPYTGAGNEVKFLIDGAQVATAGRSLDTQTFGMDMVAYGYHYRVNYPGWFDDCAMYAQPPVTPTIGVPVALSDTAIRWNLTDNSNNEIGFKMQDAAQTTVASAAVSNATGGAVYADETGLTANTPYTRFAKAFNGTLDSSPTGNVTRWTLPVAPTTSNVVCDKPTGYSGAKDFAFTAVGGFGQGTLAYYRYAWDTSPTHAWSGSEATWDSGDLILTAAAGTYYLHVQAYNGEGAANGTLDLGPYIFTETPPTNPTSAVETNGALSGVWQSTISAPSFTWAGATASAGIAGYYVYLGDDEVGESSDFVTSAAYTSPALTTGTYYLRLRTKDGAGNTADEWATLFSFRYDASAPDTPVVMDDGAYSASKSKIHASWFASDLDSDIAEYQYAVGTSVGAADVVGWTSAGGAMDAVIAIPDPGMQIGTTYYVSVKAKNGAELWSEVGSSDGLQPVALTDKIGQVKALPDGVVGVAGKIVTAVFPGGFYIQEADKSSGILVQGSGPAAGAVVSVAGTLGVNGVGERAILDPVVTTDADPDPLMIPGALQMIGSALGGSQFGAYTAGAAGRVGVNNVGLLVKVHGTVIEEQETYFTITDGSAEPIKIITSDLNGLGLLPGDHVTVTGISSLELDVVLKPVIRMIDADGVKKL